ncbi:MAG: pyrroline-5-carboxylate reductase [Alphaproteobacteria bacterium]|nr:pyrroline-5-carboxylate reductase [Alphaproteobacteria bacterium]
MSVSKTSAPILLVGAGRMGFALLKAWLATSEARQQGEATQPIMVLEPTPSPDLQQLAQAEAITLNPTPDMIKAARPSMVVFAVKPQMAQEIIPPLAPLLPSDCLSVSILAGIYLASLAAHLGPRKIIRAIPNLAATIGHSMTVLYASEQVEQVERAQVETLFAEIGKIAWLESEADIDIATAISGSGPAYVFYLTESLAAAAVDLGLPKNLAMQLARATVIGAGHMLHQSTDNVSVLRENVTSPAGTTAAALDVLMEEGGLPQLIRRAAKAAVARARELGS